MPHFDGKMKIKKNKKIESGFSLIELLIVVVILGVIVSIAIPNLYRAKRVANEGAAISTLSLIQRTQMAFRVSNGDGEFATLSTLNSNGLLDDRIGTGDQINSGYRFEVEIFDSTPTAESRINIRSRPVLHAVDSPLLGTGGKDFGVSENGGLYKTDDNTPVTFDETTREVTGTAVPFDKN